MIMSDYTGRRALIVLITALYGMQMCGRSDYAGRGEMVMSELCDKLEERTALTLTIDKTDSTRIRFVFANHHEAPLWVPQEKEPAYRVDEQGQAVTISYGYFEDVYGSYREHYMLPPMDMIAPGQQYGWELSNPVLVAKILASGFRTQVRARVALRAFAQSRVRGEQELDAYLKESCVINSAAVSIH